MRGDRLRWSAPRADVRLAGGPSYARDADDTDEPYEPPKIRLGFTPTRRVVDEPLTWEGDQA